MFKLSNMSYSAQRRFLIVSFLIVPLTLLITFTFIPVINMIGYSFTDWNGFSEKNFVGLENYITLFTDPEYFAVFKVSLYYFVGSIVQLTLALYFATILSFKIRAKNFFKGVLFFPYLINGVAIGFIFLFFFKPDGGLDTVLNMIGLGSFDHLWLGDPKIINVSLVGTSVWRYMGNNFIIFLGAISSIPSELYEAAEMDGANRWHQFKYIIFPSIKIIISLNLILAVSGAISAFEIPYIMTGGSNGSETFVIQTVDTAFKYGKIGLGSAMAVVLMLIVVIVTVIQRKFFSEGDA
ncbi:carbohydrate ABC transporter permease [Bacillus andreraoultii]|uniref:carbohydrate ABC transporter permease n=1 Tax=Bacillus andreraoultii TaxID=1499685 RepID=UPI00053B0028|nr:sugar ABC transporter permease [Bacillus andreraoultii]